VAEVPRILLEGRPGVCKTTVAAALADRLRERGRRVGFAVQGLDGGGQGMIATVMSGCHPFTDALKQRSDVELVEVTLANRDRLPARLASGVSRG
jgi:nucleoside-triphosphatase THEP1